VRCGEERRSKTEIIALRKVSHCAENRVYQGGKTLSRRPEKNGRQKDNLGTGRPCAQKRALGPIPLTFQQKKNSITRAGACVTWLGRESRGSSANRHPEQKVLIDPTTPHGGVRIFPRGRGEGFIASTLQVDENG